MAKDPNPPPPIEASVEYELEKSRLLRAKLSREREAGRQSYEVVETRSPSAIPRTQRKP